jgi:hypothetical protein
MTTLKAVGSFSVELLLSAIIISPFFIFVKHLVIPYFVALIVEEDVKKAAVDYGNSRAFKRRQNKMGMRERMSSLAKSIETGATRVGRAMSGQTADTRKTRLSVDNGDGTKRREKSLRFSINTSGSSGIFEEGGRVSRGGLTTRQVEMIDMRLNEGRVTSSSSVTSMGANLSESERGSVNPMRMLTAQGSRTGEDKNEEDRWWQHEAPTSDWEALRKQHEHDADDEDIVQNWIMHYTEEGTPYFEHGPTRRVTYTVPLDWMDDQSDDEWESSIDEESRHVYYINMRSGRTCWENPNGKERSRAMTGEGGVEARRMSAGGHGREGEGGASENLSQQEHPHHHHPHASHNPKFMGDEPIWQEVKDEQNGASYFWNRITRASTWTDRR